MCVCVCVCVCVHCKWHTVSIPRPIFRLLYISAACWGWTYLFSSQQTADRWRERPAGWTFSSLRASYFSQELMWTRPKPTEEGTGDWLQVDQVNTCSTLLWVWVCRLYKQPANMFNTHFIYRYCVYKSSPTHKCTINEQKKWLMPVIDWLIDWLSPWNKVYIKLIIHKWGLQEHHAVHTVFFSRCVTQYMCIKVTQPLCNLHALCVVELWTRLIGFDWIVSNQRNTLFYSG